MTHTLDLSHEHPDVPRAEIHDVSVTLQTNGIRKPLTMVVADHPSPGHYGFHGGVYRINASGPMEVCYRINGMRGWHQVTL